MRHFAYRVTTVLSLAFVFSCKDELPLNPKPEGVYKENQLVVMYKEDASPDARKIVEGLIGAAYPNATRTVCSSCDDLAELWEAPGIHALIDGHSDVRRVGSSRLVGVTDDENVVFSVNFINSFPEDSDLGEGLDEGLDFPQPTFESKQEVLVAILDSGVDLNLFPSQFLWNVSNENCYQEGKVGWNFIRNNGDVHDDTDVKHGTLVNAYILEQFLLAGKNIPRLLNVKVLDEDNSGTLFSLVCGIFYARSRNANIINTSLGYYDYDLGGNKHPYLSYLITELLRKDNILLVTASGNQTIASEGYFSEFGSGNSRSLADHHFYPAHLGETNENAENNIIVATTVDSSVERVSPRQNHSKAHVDIGVVADFEDGEFFNFQMPFAEPSAAGFTTGSSFAAAIATGKIAANVPPDFFMLISEGQKGELSLKLSDEDIFITPSPPVGFDSEIYLGRYLKKR